MKSKLPSEFRLIELLFKVIKNEREEVLEMLGCDELVLSTEG